MNIYQILLVWIIIFTVYILVEDFLFNQRKRHEAFMAWNDAQQKLFNWEHTYAGNEYGCSIPENDELYKETTEKYLNYLKCLSTKEISECEDKKRLLYLFSKIKDTEPELADELLKNYLKP